LGRNEGGLGRIMRSAFIVLIATTMVASGAYVVLLQLKASPVMYRFLISGILIIALGLYLLWDEFLR